MRLCTSSILFLALGVNAGAQIPDNTLTRPAASGEGLIPATAHGELHHEHFITHVALGMNGNEDALDVYTPPGYDPAGRKTYPVLYLLHGWGDTADGWATRGQEPEIMDRLIDAGKAKPMIVVMPTGYGDMSFLRNGFNVWSDPTAIDHNVGLFQESLFTEVMPRVASEYRIAKGRENTAIAGLSMGGLEALTIGLNNTGKFAWIGGFSAADHMMTPADLSHLDPKTADLKLLWISCGTDDNLGLLEPNLRLAGTLKSEGLPVMEVETPGRHAWPVWRDNLEHFAPLLFQPGEPQGK